MKYIVGITKESREANVVLLSSDYGYPYRLQEAGLNLLNIQNVILISEVPRTVMIDMLTKEWKMGPELAEEFFKYFGGHVHFAFEGLRKLKDVPAVFNPFDLLDKSGVRACLQHPGARAHLISIADKGFSPVSDLKTDEGARLIAQENVGGVIKSGTKTWGKPEDMWTIGTHGFVVIPTFHFMRMLIIEELKHAPPIVTSTDHSIINVTYNDGIPVQVEFKKTDSDSALEKAIRQAIGVPIGSLLRLRRVSGPDVAITAGLDSSEYEVTVTPAPAASVDGMTSTHKVLLLELNCNGKSSRVKISKRDTAEVVKEAICMAVEIPVGTAFRLKDKDGDVTGISSNMPSGVYTVEVASSTIST